MFKERFVNPITINNGDTPKFASGDFHIDTNFKETDGLDEIEDMRRRAMQISETKKDGEILCCPHLVLIFDEACTATGGIDIYRCSVCGALLGMNEKPEDSGIITTVEYRCDKCNAIVDPTKTHECGEGLGHLFGGEEDD